MRRSLGTLLALALLVSVSTVPAAADAAAHPGRARARELSESTRLADRRAVVVGDRLYATATADGLYPAMGFHTRGEMGGFWTPPIKLLDGIWFRVGRRWLGAGTRAVDFTSGWGYTRTTYTRTRGVAVERTDVVPDGLRAGLIGLTLRSSTPRRLPLVVERTPS